MLRTTVFFRKSLYQSVFEYSLPLSHPGRAVFEFRELAKCTDTTNPWKDSFKQLVNSFLSIELGREARLFRERVPIVVVGR